jgi:4-hydroxybutyrate---CoA ligase (AMP-forming)
MGSGYHELYKESVENPGGFWSGVASELHWHRRWRSALDGAAPFFRWFAGGETNITYNALDRHPSDRLAFVWAGSDGRVERYTYGEVLERVRRYVCLLRGLGVGRGDRVTVYMPMVPETAFILLAVARVGAVHSVVFSGFGVHALAERIKDSGSRLLISADFMYRRGKRVGLLQNAEDAAKRVGGVQLLRYFREERRFEGEAEADGCAGEPTWVEATEPLFILYTSGTTGKPKGLYHGHGQYMVWAYAHTKWLFGFKPGDILFSTADIGWINGHTYGLYGPLLNGSAVLWYEDAPDHPHPGIWWELVEKIRPAFIWLAPTAVRLLMRYGEEWVRRYDTSSLKLVISAGEILGHEPWRWLRDNVCRGHGCEVIETWGQTENSGFIAAPGGLGLGGIRYKQGSVGLPYPGLKISVVDDKGVKVPPGVKGHVVVEPPTPPAFALGVWGDPERWVQTYWNKFPGLYYTGDVGYYDEEGYLYILGRGDDVIKVAGHRLAPAEIENVAMSHPHVVEAAAVEVPDEVRGSVLAIFAVPKSGFKVEASEILELVKREFGPVAVVSRIFIVERLPKTRTGKIMRRVLRAVASGSLPGDLSTLEDEASVEEIKRAIEELRGASRLS